MKKTQSQNKYLFVYDIILLVLTIKSLLDNEVTVFYVLYLFWWRELIYTIACFIVGKSQLMFISDRLKTKRDEDKANSSATTLKLLTALSDRIKIEEDRGTTYSNGSILILLISLFPMVIYFVFIFIVFGVFDGTKNLDNFAINISILFFNNLYFNISLLIFIVEFAFFTYKNYFTFDFSNQVMPFNLRHITLHISIIFGTFIKFLVVDSYEGIFTATNTYGTLLIITPFLLLKYYFRNSYYPMYRGKNNIVESSNENS